LQWCFAQGALSAIWSIEDGEDPGRGLAIANATRSML
jgi:streptomycin 6-kinase